MATISVYPARSVSQIKTPQCAPQKRRGDTSAAAAAVAEQDKLAVAQQGCCATHITLFSTENSERMDAPRTQRAAQGAAYQNEMPARPQSRRVKRLRGRAAETIILQGGNPLMQEREYRSKLMSTGADTVTYTAGGGSGTVHSLYPARGGSGSRQKYSPR